MEELRGRRALVTGAAKRIGREIALGLAAEGVHCLLHHHRSAEQISEVVQGCRDLGVEAEAVHADFLCADAIEGLGQEAAARGIDILVHNASTFSRIPFLETSAAEHRRVLERNLQIHVEAPYLLGRILGETMVERGWGRIVLIGDGTSEAAVFPHYAPYVVSKSAVPTLAKVLALELGGRCPAVTVNAVLPGPILPAEGHAASEREMVRRQTVLGDWIGPRDVVRAVVFLATSPGITGTAVRVDGGRGAKAL